jgi:predicted ATPase
MWRAFGEVFESSARAWSDAPGGLEDMRRGAELLRDQNVLYDSLIKIALARAEARAGNIDRAVAVLDEALATSERIGHRTFDAELHRVRGEMLLKRDPANPAIAEEALQTAIAVAKRQGTRSFELRAALALAKLLRSTGRPVEAHAILAPALEGFSASPEMLEIAEAQALLAALAESEEVKAEAESRQRRLQLQTRYGQAMMYSRGFASDESKTAFARALTLAAGAGDASERFDAYYGLFVGSLLGGELSLARDTAESFLREAETEGRMTEAAAARRWMGTARLWQGDLIGAEANLAEALRTYDPERDRDAKFRFGVDTGAGAAIYLALARWALGDVERARTLSNEALARADETAHAPTRAVVNQHISLYQVLRGDPQAARRTATILTDLSREHGMALWLTQGGVYSNWARAWLGDRESGMTALREALAGYLGQGNKLFVPLYQGRLAELEAEAHDADGALQRIDDALALANETGEHWTDALLHRIRGEILLKRDPANPAPAEEAFQTAVAVAQAQKARSFELQAALALATLYQSTGRPAEAHAVLGPALEGFAPTPEMPEIAEAQALLAALAESEEVKAEAAQRRRMAQLRVAYGNALIAARGYGAPETTEAFVKARESAAGDANAPERLEAEFGLWVSSYTRAELTPMRAHAAELLKGVAARLDTGEACVAYRVAGVTHWFAGEYREAKEHLERGLAMFQPGRDDDLAFRFGSDAGVAAMLFLANAIWPLGDVTRAIALVERAQERIESVPHANSRAFGKLHTAIFELTRGELSRAAPHALELTRVARAHDLPMFRAVAAFLEAWAKSHTGAPAGACEDMSRAADLLREQNVRPFDGPLKIAHAEAEAKIGDPGRAISILDDALADFRRTGYCAYEAQLHRVRGEILLKRDPRNLGPAGEALQTAIAVARQQGTRSFELRAALSLAKLYQSTNRLAEAHAVLAPALEGFAPALEMPEISEAQALLATLAKTGR